MPYCGCLAAPACAVYRNHHRPGFVDGCGAGGLKAAICARAKSWRAVWVREIRPDVSFAEKRLLNIVQEMAVAAHMPRPQVMLQPRVKAINAFATGWNQADWVIVVTEGALDWLTREELQALLAHEMSHLHEGDTRINMQLAGMVAGLEMLHNYGDMLRNFGKADKVEQTPAVAVLAWVPGQVIMAVVGWAGWPALLQAAVAREREWLADARAVQWTRSRDGLVACWC